jgi:pescadillo protein
MTRLAALNKLQLSLNDFRRLCILKGIYPREPKNRRKAQKGHTQIKILYHKKDINFLLHDKLIWTLRDIKVMNRRIKYADSVGDRRLKRLRINKYPELRLDHVVKERYPTFIDAVKDLDDCLTLLFLFSTFPAIKCVTRSQTSLCRRLSIEFMHYVIAAKALRKVFVSIKGYYFQAEIKGELITWIVPHYYPYQPQSKNEVDFRIMANFVEFYTVMCGFVNFRLYHTLNLNYPPQFNVSIDSEESQSDENVFVSERIAALNCDIKKIADEEIEEPEEMDLQLISNEGDSEKIRQMHEREQDLKRKKNLFKGLKFFINREVPREPLVFIIRCFGGKVSWDKSCFVGASFDEDDETITHQIVDRPSIGKQYISRDYIQPQWIFDSVNQSRLLPTNKYFLGVTLPPHLSPFTNAFREGLEYVPPEEKALRDPNLVVTHELSEEGEDMSDNEPDYTEGELNFALVNAFKEENKQIRAEAVEEVGSKRTKIEEADVADMLENSNDEAEDNDDDDGENESNDDNDETNNGVELTKEQKRELEKEKMKVTSGKVFKVDYKKEKKLTEQESKLRSKMVKSRHRKLYYDLLKKREKATKESKMLEDKRKSLDENRKKVRAKKGIKA